MKFSVKSIYPISTSSRVAQFPGSWEFGAAEVEYLSISADSQHQGQNTEGNDDFYYDPRYISLNLLNSKPELDVRSGRYKRRNA
ncbi:hypothetical protein H6G56_17760 [Anabaena variabilis FACHB-164]|uniref:Uncharacterized protein n=1 Tax=Anabaena catenula FACHB-362 TaxID=2692877 RepID=A0ABR8J6G2_9NOST|nr:hypothetical protein [Trichormus variabilis FACHB-164]MBD2693262.1 hypothetical protein [Anabaena catenula FACHB-362]